VQSRPDVLVLGGGGVLGEAWLSGVLAGIEDAAGLDLRNCEHFVGTSAGAIVAARLAAGLAPERPPGDGGSSPPEAAASQSGSLALALIGRAGRLALVAASPLVPVALSLAAPAGALARATVLRMTPRAGGALGDLATRIDATGAQFDGRLRVVAVARATGRRVVFGRPGAPAASVGAAVEASCTVPWLFAPARIDGVEYVDGGLWSPTNLDAAPAGRGTHVLCLNPTAGLGGRGPAIAAARHLSGSVAAVEAGALRGRRAVVSLLAPDARSAAAIGTDLMDPRPRATVLAAAYRQGLLVGNAESGSRGRRGPQATTPEARVRGR
jgi:NTE family protein